MRRLLVVLALGSATTSLAGPCDGAPNHTVPGSVQTIQQAIDISGQNDVILVEATLNGWNEILTIHPGKVITLCADTNLAYGNWEICSPQTWSDHFN